MRSSLAKEDLSPVQAFFSFPSNNNKPFSFCREAEEERSYAQQVSKRKLKNGWKRECTTAERFSLAQCRLWGNKFRPFLFSENTRNVCKSSRQYTRIHICIYVCTLLGAFCCQFLWGFCIVITSLTFPLSFSSQLFSTSCETTTLRIRSLHRPPTTTTDSRSLKKAISLKKISNGMDMVPRWNFWPSVEGEKEVQSSIYHMRIITSTFLYYKIYM